MDKQQLAVLYREFLFRMVDRDLLSVHAEGDINKLLGRLAAILIWISIPFGAMALGVAEGSALVPEHIVIATSMLVVSLFSVLAWDSLFPERRDVFILMPLGVNALTIFAAKAASLFVALSAAVIVFNGFPGILFPLALTPPGSNLLDWVFSIQLYRAFAAYWLTMFLAGGFILCSIICIQAATSQLPRPLALRFSSILQIATFCTAVGVYFLQPSLASSGQLVRPENQAALAWLPSYWFLGLFQQLNGTVEGPAREVLANLAHRAWVALAVAGAGAAGAVLISCLGALRKIAEQPDVVPRRHRRLILPVFLGGSARTAIVLWTARTLLRSRQHRVLVTFYSGIGFAAIILFLRAPVVHIMSRTAAADPWRDLSLPLIGASFVMTICWIVGVRAAFAIPVELRANWIFRLNLTNGPAEPLAGTRASLYAVGLAPAWFAAAIAFLWLWPWAKAVQHLLILALLGAALLAWLLRDFHKIPFACAYLPGTSHIHITFALCAMLGLNLLFWAAKFEREAMFEPMRYLQIIGVLAAVVAVCWWRLRAEHPPALCFDEAPTPAVLTLGLDRDGYAIAEGPRYHHGTGGNVA